MFYRAVLLCICLTSLSVSAVYADAEGALSWEDCLQEARKNHPDLVSAAEKLKGAQAQKGITVSGALPQISSNLSAVRSKSTGKSEANAFGYGLTGKQLLFDGFKTPSDIAAAKESVRAAKYNYEVVSSNVRLNLSTAFTDLLSAQENLGVVEAIAKRRKQNLDKVTLSYQGGREHKGSLMTEQANLAQADLDVQQANRNLELSQRRLSRELGREQFTPIVATGDLTLKDLDLSKPDFEGMVNAVPFLKELSAQKEAARFGVKSAQGDFFPQIYANASAGKSDSSWPPGQNAWSAGFSVTLPLFQGGSQQAQLSKARAAFNQSQADERSGRDGMIFTLAQTWTNWQDGAAQVDVQKKFLGASEERAKIVEAQYSAGLVTFNDWIIIEDDLVRNQKAFVQTKANALIAQANWQQAKGETLDE